MEIRFRCFAEFLAPFFSSSRCFESPSVSQGVRLLRFILLLPLLDYHPAKMQRTDILKCALQLYLPLPMGIACIRHGDIHILQVGSYTVKTKKVLARGGYGFVYLAQDFSKRDYALKIIGLSTPEGKKTFEKETEILKIIGDHPNIVKVYATEKKQETGFILMELANVTLWQILSKTLNSRVTQSQIVYILRQIAAGLKHIHSKGYAHRDIKTENILVMDDGSIRICDFGSCTNEFMNTDDIKTSKAGHYQKEFGCYTTVMFRPPELINFDWGYRIDQQMDMWMLGCIAYILCYYKVPFKGAESPQTLRTQIKLPSSASVSQPLQNFILMLLKPDPQTRATSEEALNYLNASFNLSRVQNTK